MTEDAGDGPSGTDPGVRAFMATDIPVLAPSDSILTAAKALAATGLPGLPVVDDGRLVGILTESDMIKREAEVETPVPFSVLDLMLSIDVGEKFGDEMEHVLATRVDQLMTPHVTTILPQARLTDVATVMIDRHINPLPVVDEDGSVLGVVARSHLVRLIADLEQRGA